MNYKHIKFYCLLIHILIYMSIRVGRLKYPNYIPPNVPNFKTIYVMTEKFPGEFNILSPFSIKDQYGRIMENIWQFSRVFQTAFKTVRPRGYKDKKMETSLEEKIIHVDNGMLTDNYMEWRKKGANYNYHIRYSNGLHDRHLAMYAYAEKQPILLNDTNNIVRNKLDLTQRLDYIESRKIIYAPLYIQIVKLQPKFQDLLHMLQNGENLLIVEVDGPHQESLKYYKDKYGVDDNFITNSSMVINQYNIDIMLNDPKHNFGHGYCLAMALLDLKIN